MKAKKLCIASLIILLVIAAIVLIYLLTMDTEQVFEGTLI